MTLRLVDLDRQYQSLKGEIDEALVSVAASTQYVLGEEVARFEQEFAVYSEVANCVGVSSGTSAVQLSLEAIGVGPGDEVIVPANTFFASVAPVLRLGARPVLVDCDDATATIDVEQAAATLGERTKALIAVHLYGQPANLDPLLEVCGERGVAVVEDAAQAHGARYRGRRVGGIGTVAAFSFYPAKNLGAYGDAGAVTTNDATLAERLRLLRNFGAAEKYRHLFVAGNERLDTLQAAVLLVKLRRLDEWNAARRRHAASYAAALAGTGLVLPQSAAGAEHVWHLYVVRVPHGRRDELRVRLAESGIETGMHYPVPLHLQPALLDLGYRKGQFPVSEAWADEGLSLPMFPELEEDEVREVASLIADTLA